MTDYAALRTTMVESQIKPNKVTNTRLLHALAEVPREEFLPRQSQSIAYIDEDLPLGNGRYLMEPMILARLIEELSPEPDDIALDIGCGMGYSTAVLSRVVATVVGVESNTVMVEEAGRKLVDLGFDGAVVVEGSLTEGYRDQQPYNLIMFGGAVAEVPQAILDQLADGGRLVAVIRPDRFTGQAWLYQRIGESVSRRQLFDANIPWLPEFAPVSGFEF